MNRKDLAEKSADRVKPKCRESYIKGYMAAASAGVRGCNKILFNIRKAQRR